MPLARPHFGCLLRIALATTLALGCSLASAAGLTRLDLARAELTPAFSPQTPAYAAALASDVATASTFATPADASTRLFLKPANASPWQEVARGSTVVAGARHSLVLRLDGRVLAWGDDTHGQTTVPLAAQSGTTALAAGHSHSLALLENGSVLAWGNDTYGQSTVPSAALSGIVAIAAGGDQSLALTASGSVIAWGLTYTDELPASVADGVVAIFAGDEHAVALKSSGAVITWGNTPAPPPEAASGVIAISAGFDRTLALKRDGTVLAWGYTHSSLLTVPAAAHGAVALAVGQSKNFALLANGSVIAWGPNIISELDPPTSTASDVVSISVGEHHALALKRDGSLVVWGTPIYGLIYPPPSALNSLRLPSSAALPLAYGTSRLGLRVAPVATPASAPVPLASLRNRTLSVNPNRVYAIRTDGSVYTWGGEAPPPSVGSLVALAARGSNSLGIRTDGSLATWYSTSAPVPSDATDLIGISAYASNYLALRRDGRVVAWGTASVSLIPLPSTAQSGVVAIAAGTIFNLALRADGSVISWGTTDTPYAPPSAAGTDVVAIAISAQNALALKSDGSLLVWGNPTTSINQIPTAEATGLIALAADPGGTHALALRSDGRVIAWGSNTYGQTTVPTAAQSGVVAIAVGTTTSFALKSDGTLVAWGSPSSIPTTAISGLLVPPASSSLSITSPIDQLAPRVPLAAGDGFTVALRDTGTPVAWGSVTTANTPPPNASALVALTARDGFTLALRSDGTVTGWGTASYGQLTIPSTASGVVALAAGATHVLALKKDGSVIGWGSGSSGQTTVPNLNPAPTTADGYVFTAIAAADNTSFGLRSDGRVIAWGSSSYGLTTVPAAAQTEVVAIAAGTRHALALKRDGSVVGWGENSYGQAQSFSPRVPVTAIAAGDGYSIYLYADGTVGGIGSNGFYVPSTATGVIALAAGRNHAAALRSDGSVLTWGGGVTYPTPAPLSVLRPGPPGDDYQVAVTRAYPSPDLAALSLASGPLTPAFSPATTAYTHTTPATPGTIGLDPTPATPGATVQVRINGAATRTLLTGPTFALTSSELLGLTETGGFTSTNASHTAANAIPAAARQDLVSLVYVQNRAVGLTRQGGLVSWTPGNSTPDPIPAELASGLRQIVPTDTDILALRTDGTVLAWTPGSPSLNSVPLFAQSGVVRLSARNSTRLALFADGSARGWGNLSPPPPEASSDVVSIFAGDGLAFAQKTDGTLLLWGNHHSAVATLPAATRTGITDLIADYSSVLALLADGSVIAWGDPSLPSLTTPAAASTGVVALAAHGPTRAVQKANGTVATWTIGSTLAPQINALPLATPRSARLPLRFGDNRVSLRITPLGRPLSDAPLATGYSFHLAVTPQGSIAYRPASTSSPSIIIPTEAQSNVTSVFTGGSGTYALTTAGRAVTLSGSTINPGLQPSAFGQTPVVPPIASISVGQSFALLLRTDGSVGSVGSPPGGPLPAFTDAVAVAAGTYHALILRANGQVTAAGYNTSTVVPAAAQSGIIAIAAALDRSMALRSDGSVVTWGNNFAAYPTPPEALSGVIGIALNDTQALALRADGSVVAWGSDTASNPPPAAVSSGVIALFASGRHQVALKADGTTVTWGRHTSGGILSPADFGGPLLSAPVRDYQLTVTRDFPPPSLAHLSASGDSLAPAFAPDTSTYALPATPYPALALTGFSSVPGDEISVRTGTAPFTPRLPGPTLATTYGSIVAITPEGTLQTFGSSPGNISTATQSGITAIAIAYNYSAIALKTDGSLLGFGENSYNLLSALPGGTDFVAIAAGRSHALAVRRDGSVAAWGDSSAQKLTVPATATDVIAVAAGDYTSIALRRDGTPVAWGRYTSIPQSIPPEAQSGLIAVAAGRDHYLALRADGRAVQFGNTSGMSEVPPYRFIAIGASGDQNLGLRPNGELVSWGSPSGPAPQLTPANSTGIASFVFGSSFIAAQRLDGSLLSIPSSFPGLSNLNGSPAFAGPFALPLNALQPLALGANTVELRVSRPGSELPPTTYDIAVTRLPAPGFSLFPGTVAAPPNAPAYSHNFGLHRLATPSPAQPFTLLNTGTADLVVSSASLVGSQSSDFSVSGLSLPLTLAPGATTTFTATTTPSAIGNRLGVLGLTTNLPNGEPAGFAFRSEGITLAYDLNYWRTTQFFTAILEDPALEATVWGDLADPDGDGLPNLLEYATGTDALLPYGGSSSVALDPAAPGGPRLTLTYLRRQRAQVGGLVFQVEWSDSLAPGSWSTTGVTETVIDTFGFNETVLASVPIGPSARFLRLRVTAP